MRDYKNEVDNRTHIPEKTRFASESEMKRIKKLLKRKKGVKREYSKTR